MLKRLIRNKQDLYSLEFLHKSWNLRSNFTDLEKVWKIEIKSWKNGKIPVFFFQSYNKWFKSVFFLFCSNVIQSCPYVCSAPWKTLVFRRFLRSLFKNLSLEKEITVLKKSLEKVLNFGSRNLYEPWTSVFLHSYVIGSERWSMITLPYLRLWSTTCRRYKKYKNSPTTWWT